MFRRVSLVVAVVVVLVAVSAAAASSRFSDVPVDHVASDTIGWAATVGVTAGYGDGTFRPDLPLPKRHAVAFMNTYYDNILGAEQSTGFTRADMMMLLHHLSLADRSYLNLEPPEFTIPSDCQYDFLTISRWRDTRLVLTTDASDGHVQGEPVTLTLTLTTAEGDPLPKAGVVIKFERFGGPLYDGSFHCTDSNGRVVWTFTEDELFKIYGDLERDEWHTRALVKPYNLFSNVVEFVYGDGSSRFSDVPSDHPAAVAIAWAYNVRPDGRSLGVTSGYPDGTFRPDLPLPKRHAIAFMNTYYDNVLGAEESTGFTRGDMMMLLHDLYLADRP